jgi:AcrR family transcriptional regulator
MTKYMDRHTKEVPLPSHGHRERKKARIREQLTEAAVRLFSERGFEQTKVEDITAAADIVPRTFFRYFSSKDDALFSWYDLPRDAAVAALRSRPRGEGIVTALIAALDESARASGAQRVLRLTSQVIAKSPELRGRLDAVRAIHRCDIANTLAHRLPRSAALVVQMVTAAVVTAYAATVDKWVAEGARGPMSDYTGPAMKLASKIFASVNAQYVLRQ